MNEDPYAKALSVVWRDPMEYDMQKHGPPYMPEIPVEQRRDARLFPHKYAVEAKRFVQKSAAFYDVPQKNVYAPLTVYLAFQRALYMVHQTHHWQTRAGHYYSDHLLFQRIYEDSSEHIDSTAERLIGLASPEQVSICSQIRLIHELIGLIYDGRPEPAPAPEKLVSISLRAEMIFLSVLREVKRAIEEQGGLTDGLDDLIQGTANKHEEFVYLLKQRDSYTYDRR
jgi:DNA-binding ferritin-like protein